MWSYLPLRCAIDLRAVLERFKLFGITNVRIGITFATLKQAIQELEVQLNLFFLI